MPAADRCGRWRQAHCRRRLQPSCVAERVAVHKMERGLNFGGGLGLIDCLVFLREASVTARGKVFPTHPAYDILTGLD